jgi:hypothetical protein
MNTPAIHIERLTINLQPQPRMFSMQGLDALARAISTEAETVTATADTTERFERSSDGTTVTDHKTGLQWAAEESAKELTFADAEKHCAELRLGGFEDWRLPDLEELESLRDLTRHNPCIDTAFFKSNAGWTWTRTPTAWSSGCAWIVHFDGGYVDYGNRHDRAFVRAVRGVSSPAGQ